MFFCLVLLLLFECLPMVGCLVCSDVSMKCTMIFIFLLQIFIFLYVYIMFFFSCFTCSPCLFIFISVFLLIHASYVLVSCRCQRCREPAGCALLRAIEKFAPICGLNSCNVFGSSCGPRWCVFVFVCICCAKLFLRAYLSGCVLRE